MDLWGMGGGLEDRRGLCDCVCLCVRERVGKRGGEVGGPRRREERRQRECVPSASWLVVFCMFEAAMLDNSFLVFNVDASTSGLLPIPPLQHGSATDRWNNVGRPWYPGTYVETQTIHLNTFVDEAHPLTPSAHPDGNGPPAGHWVLLHHQHFCQEQPEECDKEVKVSSWPPNALDSKSDWATWGVPGKKK